MMRALVLGQAERDRIAALRERAAAEPFSAAEIMRAARTGEPLDPQGRLTIDIPHGYRVAYSLQHQPKIGLSRVIEVGLPDSPGRAPNQFAMAMLLEAFDFEAVRGAEVGQELPLMLAALESARLYANVDTVEGVARVSMLEPL